MIEDVSIGHTWCREGHLSCVSDALTGLLGHTWRKFSVTSISAVTGAAMEGATVWVTIRLAVLGDNGDEVAEDFSADPLVPLPLAALLRLRGRVRGTRGLPCVYP